MHAYAVDQLLRQMIARAQELELRVIEPPAPTIEKLLVMLTMQTTSVLHTGYPKVALKTHRSLQKYTQAYDASIAGAQSDRPWVYRGCR